MYVSFVCIVGSACSDGVKLCETYEEAKDQFDTLMSRRAVYGGKWNGI